MNDIEFSAYMVLGTLCIALVTYLIAKKQLSANRFLRFLGILGIGMFGSLFPWGPFGFVMGFPAVLLSSILVSLFLDKKNKSSKRKK